MWNNTKYAILNIDNLNTKMSEIQSVLDEIKECKKHATDGICSFLGSNVYFFLDWCSDYNVYY